MTAEPLWLFADQLGPHVHSTDEHCDREVVLVESARVLRRKRFHRQKVHLVLSGMRHLAADTMYLWHVHEGRRPRSRSRAQTSSSGRVIVRPSGWRTSTAPSAAGSTC